MVRPQKPYNFSKLRRISGLDNELLHLTMATNMEKIGVTGAEKNYRSPTF